MSRYFLGIDGGGSNCRARLESDTGDLLAIGHAGPANVATNPELAKTNIAAATTEALQAANLAGQESTINAALGLAGFNLPAGKIAVESWSSPFAQCLITTDMHIACVGAHGGKDGAIMILGTGSSAVVCMDEQQRQLGGYGFPVGDQASGAWLGLGAVQTTLLMMDGLEQNNTFKEAILQATGAANAIELAEVFHAAKPADFARLAPTVLALAKSANDCALGLVQQACVYIEGIINLMLDLKADNIALVGGLAEPLSEFLSESAKTKVSPALLTPLQGAALLARQKFNNRVN